MNESFLSDAQRRLLRETSAGDDPLSVAVSAALAEIERLRRLTLARYTIEGTVLTIYDTDGVTPVHRQIIG
jgi:hypothetical protein